MVWLGTLAQVGSSTVYQPPNYNGFFIGGSMTEIKSQFELDEDIKRCYFPGIIMELSCPNCGAIITRDFGSDYINYAKTGSNEIHLICDHCDKEYKIDVSITLESKFVFDESNMIEG